MRYMFLIFLPFLANAQVKNSPKLVVGIVVDQMCYDYLYRFEEKYGKDGLLKLRDGGTNCRNTNYNYVPTYTGPGHASIYTGTTPATHGIVANDWYDRELGREKNCVEDTAALTVGSGSSYGKCSPHQLRAHTITDQLKLNRNGEKVISMSIKNRGAILPGGHMSDGSYWFDYSNGNFISSSFFMDQLPSWVNSFNSGNYPEDMMQGIWDTYYPISSYTESDKDDRIYEHLLPGKDRPVFPYDLKDMIAKSGFSAYELFTSTPYANTYLTDFAMAALNGEMLGQDDVTDMLCISYSTPDIIGHSFGPYSVEIEDTYIRLDREIARLIKALEKQVGKNNFVLFLTADHAVVPVPQYLSDQKLPGGYFYLDTAMTELRAYCVERFGIDFIKEQVNLNLYLDREAIKNAKLTVDEVSMALAARLREHEEVKNAYTAYELSSVAHSDRWMEMVSKGYHKAESGDVIFILEPGYLPKSRPSETSYKGTSHGSAYSYDSHVPLLWYGAGIRKQQIVRPVQITDIAATLTHILELQQPSNIEGQPILELFEK